MKLNYIFALIALECRLSREQAMQLFRMDEKELEDFINTSNLVLKEALKYLFNYERVFKNEKMDKKSFFKAKLYLQKLNLILSTTDVKERKAKINSFITTLQQPNIDSLLNKPRSLWTKEEKKIFLKWKHKYAITNFSILKSFGITKNTIKKWTDSLDDKELECNLNILSDYFNCKYKAKSMKRC